MTNAAENIALMPAPAIVTNSEGETFNLSAVARGKIDIETAMQAALEEAKTLEDSAEDLKGERAETLNLASEIANRPILIGAQAVFSRALTKEEISNLLGKVYGFKPKADGTLGKTPAGSGLSIRKRIVTLSEGMSIAANPAAFEGSACPTWAKGIEPAAIVGTITRLEAGEISASVAYKTLGELKPKAKAKPLALDANKLADIVATLGDADNVATVNASAALLEAYRAIRDAMIGMNL